MDSAMRQSFFKDDFNSDQYLSKYTQNSDFNSIRQQLIQYGNELQHQMGEILKTETESIVNLAEYLTNLNSKIEDLSVPICQLREEIRTLYDLINSNEINFKTTLEDVKSRNTNANAVLLKLDVISTSIYIANILNSSEGDLSNDLVLLERIVTKFSFQRTYLTELGVKSAELEPTVKTVEIKLIDIVNKNFLNSLKCNNRDIIEKCLQMYDNLAKHAESERIYQINIVRPALNPILTEKQLEKHNDSIEVLYQQVINFINHNMKLLLEIVKSKSEFYRFDFILNSFWPEFDRQTREKLPHITAPGNPDLFQKRFTSTWNLFCLIADKCGDEHLILENESLKEHLKRFNLPVYFEIRFQQIASNFESNVIRENVYCTNENELNCRLNVTLAFWRCVKQCFHSDVFIKHLSDQFIKLFLLLLGRYLKWFEMCLNENAFERDEIERFALNALVDHEIVKRLIANDQLAVKESIFKILPKGIHSVMVKLFASNLKSINRVSNEVREYLVNFKIRQIIVQLENIEAIPRLYRRTNRSAPREASSYVIEAVKPITLLNSSINEVFQEKCDLLLEEIINKCTLRYSEVVEKVLKSVCKTEESLRRLKSRNLGATEELNSQTDTMSDESKIREQINLDVNYFVEKLTALQIHSTFESLTKLKNQIIKA